MRVNRLALCVAALLGSLTAAHATVRVDIDLTHQTMHVDSAEGAFDWPISSARSGFSTPGGSYAPTHLELMHYSRKYHMSPMPHAIFFRGGYAIHGTYATGSLGRPASHGCVRLSPGHAAALYSMVQHEGARISISGTPPTSRPFGATRYARNDDADTLARLAPSSNEATAYGTYGDAPVVRSRRPRRAYYGYGDAAGYGYRYEPAPYGDYRSGYSYAPAYQSPPQVLYRNYYRQAPPVLGFGD